MKREAVRWQKQKQDRWPLGLASKSKQLFVAHVKMKAFIKLPFMQLGARVISIKDHQKLTGNVQWWFRCDPGAPFTHRM